MTGKKLQRNSLDRLLVRVPGRVNLDRRLPNSQLVVYPDAGHCGVFQFHEDFVKRALEVV